METNSMGVGGEEDTTSFWVWFGLTFIALVSFWCQAKVTEERFVPALNVIATYFNIPDDVAGATLMAAGASAPELFSSLVALFVTHSALGLGTIVGSEVFNQLVICAGCVLTATDGKLKLNKQIVAREVFFYALSITVFLYALSDRRPAVTDTTGVNHIYVSFTKASALFGVYIAYVLVCSYFDAILGLFTNKKNQTETITTTNSDYGSTLERTRSKKGDIVFDEKIPFINQTTNKQSLYDPKSQKDLSSRRLESTGMFTSVPQTTTTINEETHEVADQPLNDGFASRSLRKLSTRFDSTRSMMSNLSEGLTMRFFEFDVSVEKPSDHHQINDIEINILDDRFSCFLWQKSVFYNKSKVALKGWHLRWFTLTEDVMTSVPNRRNPEKYHTIHPMFESIEADSERLIIKLCCPNTKRKEFYLMAPSKEIFEKVVKQCEENMQHRDETKAIDTFPSEFETEGFEELTEPSLIDFPRNGSITSTALFLILFPLSFIMHLSIPDVRKLSEKGDPTSSVSMAYLAVVMCLVWLIVGSYAMVSSLEKLAELLNIPDSIVGVTVSAAGTSLPNYVASVMAAKQGFGNMAISNAFGSNTFNLTVGLGLPWTLYVAFANNFEPYHALRDDGITLNAIILASTLLFFIVLMLWTDFVLYRWHGYAFLALYAMYIAQQVAIVFISNTENS